MYLKQNKTMNEYIRKKVDVIIIVENIVESLLRCLRHVWRKSINTPLRNSYKLKKANEKPLNNLDYMLLT